MMGQGLTSPLASPSATREALEAFGLATKHRLGQNFLIDNHVIGRIMDLAAIEGDARVLEVGPGIGTLTLALVQRAAQVVSIEMDADLERILSAHAMRHPNFSFIMGDALDIPPARIAEVGGGAPTMLVANLPYNVAATLILQLFCTMPSIERAVVMVQKEVADRIAASPGTKAYGAYTVKLSLHGEVTGRFEVPPRCFMPAPHVDSAVVRIDRVHPPRSSVMPSVSGRPCAPDAGAVLAGDVTRVVDAAFAQRRKTIRNSMSSNGFAKDMLDAAFEACGIDPGARAESLEPARFVSLACALASLPGPDTP